MIRVTNPRSPSKRLFCKIWSRNMKLPFPRQFLHSFHLCLSAGGMGKRISTLLPEARRPWTTHRDTRFS